MILTDEEVADIAHATGARWNSDFVSAIETAVIARLVAGVEMPEPFAAVYIGQTEYYYTADQLQACTAAARIKALEDAAVVCENESCSCCWTEDATEMASHLQDAIRALKGTTP